MPHDRLVRILARLSAAQPDGAGAAGRLCAVSADVTKMSGAGIMLMIGDRPNASICTSNDVSALIEELQYTLGEGPCVDAFRRSEPVLEPDLAAAASDRWPAFSRSAVAGGARAVFGFPITVASTRVGALNLYRDRPGPLTDDQHADAVILASVAGRALIEMQAGAAPGTLGADLEIGTNLRLVVHQATGMVAVQLDVDVDDALARLRAHAFIHDRRISDVADDVVARRLRFATGGDELAI